MASTVKQMPRQAPIAGASSAGRAPAARRIAASIAPSSLRLPSRSPPSRQRARKLHSRRQMLSCRTQSMPVANTGGIAIPGANTPYDHFARLMHPMNCRICGQPKAGPEKLCGDCAGALRRARQGSAAVRKLPAFGSTRVAAAVATVVRRPTTLRPAALRDWRRQVAWAAVALAAIGIVNLGQRTADRPHGSDAAVVADRSPMPWAERPKFAAAPVPARQEAMPSIAGATSAAVPAFPAERSTERSTTVRLNVPQGSAPPAPTQAAGAKVGTRPAMAATNLEPGSRSSPLPKTPPNDAAAGKSIPGTPPEANASQQLTQASVAQPDQPMDDAKVLASALDICGKEGFLAGILCEQ